MKNKINLLLVLLTLTFGLIINIAKVDAVTLPFFEVTSESYAVGDKFDVSKNNNNVTVGGTLQLHAIIVHGNDLAIDESALGIYVDKTKADNTTWTSSDPKIATVDSNGKVTGVKEGSTTIVVKSADVSLQEEGNISYKINVVASSTNDVKVKVTISNKPDVSSTKDANGYITKKYSLLLTGDFSGSVTETMVKEIGDLGLTWKSAIKSLACTGTDDVTIKTNAETGKATCTFTLNDASGIKLQKGKDVVIGTIAVKVDPNDENCELTYTYNKVTSTVDPKNPQTGSFAPYIYIIGGISLAFAMVLLSQKNTKIQKI